MSNAIAVVSADWHLEKNAWARYPTLQGDSYYGLEQIVDLCIARKLPLFAAGDLFNEAHPDPYPVWFCYQQMERMAVADLPVYHVQGQHELSRDTPWIAMHSWPVHLHKKQCQLPSGAKLYGLDFIRSEALKTELGSIPAGTDIFVTHQVWQDLMGHLLQADCALSDIASVSVVISGDYHKHCTINGLGKDGQDVLLLSPGSICMQSIVETPEKYIYILNDDHTFESIKLKSREVVSWYIATEDDLDRFVAVESKHIIPQTGVPDNIAIPIVKVKFDSNISNVYSRLEAAIGSSGHFFPRPIKSEAEDIPNTSIGLVNKSLENCVGKYFSVDTEEYLVALRLIKSSNPAAELSLIAKEMGLTCVSKH